MIDLTATIDDTQALRSFRKLKQAAENTTSSIITDADRMEIAIQKFGNTASSTATNLRRDLRLLGGGTVLVELSRKIATTRGEFQQLEVAFTTLLQDGSKAKVLMAEAVELAAKTPFSLQEVATGARQLIAYGFAAEDVADTLTRLGNVAAGLGLPMERLTYLYGTTLTQGRLYARDVIQFTTSGIPLLQELANMYGKTTEEVNAMVTAGEIGFSEVEAVFKKMTDEGGKFYNLMQEQSKTITGRISNLKDAIQVMFNEIGKSQEGVINSAISGAAYLVENYQKILDILIPLIATYGMYKTTLIAIAAVQKIQVSAAVIKSYYDLAKGVTIAKNSLIAFDAATKKTAIGLLIGLVTGVISALIRFAKKQKEANEAIEKSLQPLRDEYTQTNLLIRKLQDSNLEYAKRKEIFEELKRINPDIVKDIGNESTAYETLTGRLKEYNTQKQAEIALKKFSADTGFEEAGNNLSEAKNKLEDESTELVNVYTTLFTRFEELTFSGRKIPENIASLFESISNPDIPVVNKVESLFSAYEANIEKIKKNGGQYYKDDRYIFQSLFEDLNVKDYTKALQSYNKAEEDYAKKREQVIERINQTALAIYPNEKERKEFIDSMMNLYFPQDKKTKKDDIFDPIKASLMELMDQLPIATDKLEKLKKAAEPDQKAIDKQQGIVDSINSQIVAREKELSIIRELESQISSLKEKQKDTAVGTQEYNDLQQRIEALQAKLPKQRTKEEDLTQKAIEKAYEAELEAARELYDAETELKRKQISDKIELIQFDLEQTLAAIEEEKQAYIDLQMKTGEYANRKDVDVSVFDKRAGLAAAGADIDINAEKKARLEAEKQAMNEYLAEYGSYLEKRQALTELYNEKIAKATTEGEKLTLIAEWKSALAEIDAQANKSTSVIGQLFSDMSKHTVDEMRAIADAGEELLEFVNNGEWDVWKGIKFGIKKEEFETLGRSPEKLRSVREGIDNVRQAADDAEPALFRMGAAIRGIFSGDFKGLELEEAIKTIQEGLSDISQAGNFLSNTFSNLGESFNNDALSGIGEGLGSAMSVIDSTMQGAEALSKVGGPVGAGIGAAIGLVSSLATEIAKVHDKKKEKNIQALQVQIDDLSKAYDKLGKEVDKAYSFDAAGLIEEQNAILEKQKTLIDQQIKEEQSKKNPDPQVIENWRQQQEEINEQIQDNKEKAKDAIFGEDLQSAIENFANAYADAWASGDDRVKSSKDLVRKMMQNMVKESIKAAVASSDAMARIREKMAEFYSDGVFTQWEQDKLLAMGEEFAEELDRQFGWADSLMGPDQETSRRSTTQGIAQASQDSINVLSGGVTASLGTLYSISDDVSRILNHTSQVGSINTHAMNIRDLMIQSTAHLAAIRDNTAYCEHLEQMKTDISLLRSAVDVMSTRGVNINR